MAETVIEKVVEKVVEWLVVPIGKHICYPFKYDSNMEELKQQVEKLIDERDDIQHSVDTAKRQGDEIKKVVEKWLNSVEAFAAQPLVKPIINSIKDRAEKTAKDGVDLLAEKTAEKTEQRRQQRSQLKLCSIGFCPNLISRYSLSKKAAKIAKDGIDLLAEGKFKDVSYHLAIQRTKSVYTRGYEDFDSRMQVFEKIMKALADEDVNLIGVYGMGGVGKTTLVKRVAAQVLEDKLFDVVVMAEVTQTLDIENIQEQIADELGLKFQEKSLSGRAARLRDRLKKETNVLVILDNIWEKLNLDDVGIPSLNDERASVTQEVDERGRNAYKRQCKLLLTCRDLDVLHNDMDTQENFLVEVLSDIEAMDLFWKIAGHSREKPDFNCIAVEIVSKCAGLPIAITTIANALKNKEVSDWKDALRWLRRSNPKPIKGMEKSVYSTIELSYNILGSEEQSFFLLCCLCNSGRDICTSDLFKYSMGLGLFKDVDTMEEARNRMQTLIGNLKASSLLLDGNDKDNVKMHDIIQAVAVSIASSKDKLMFNIKNVTSIKETLEEKVPKDSIAVSLPYGDIDGLPERLEFPKLKLLLLSKYELSLQIPDAFFDGVQELKVLDLTRFHLLSLPSSLCRLTNLQTLCLDNCLIRDIKIIGELKSLEILSLLNSEIEQLPGEIRQLTRLRLLDLSRCSKLKIITPNVLSSLSRLEELYMGNNFVQWDVEGQSNASLAELKQLSNLTTLEIHVLDAQILPHDLFFWKLERYRILIGDVWDWSGKYETSRTLKLKLNNSFFLSDGIQFLLNKAEDLYLDEPKGSKNVLHELNGEGFQQLKHLHIQNAPQIQYIINSVGWRLCNIFPQRLESLVLHNLINLENIYHGQVTAESFSQLKVTKVGKCDKLKYLTLPMAGNLSQLQEIEVTHCRKLEQIVLMESRQVQSNEQISKIEFTQLRTLTLQWLPRLTRFGFSAPTPDMRLQEILAEDDTDSFIPFFSENVLLPRLENLELCSINIECGWLDQLPAVSSCCQTLVQLTVQECNSLKFLFSYSMVKSLVQLRKLRIRNCKSIERIINIEESAKEERIINMIFPKLNLLVLNDLPKLTRFGSGNSIEFPSLEALGILDCPRLKMFFSGSTCANITVSKEQEATSSCADVYPLVDKKVSLPSLRELGLNSISSQVIWHSQLLATSSSLHNLTFLSIVGLGDLKYLFSSSMANSVVQLSILEIIDCKLMEAVIVEEEKGSSLVLFPNLQDLTLCNLPKLARFCHFNKNLIDPCSLLEQRSMNRPDMETLISKTANMTASEECGGMDSKENLQANIQPLFDEKVGLLNIKKLLIKEMDNLRKIWHDQLYSDSFSKLEQVKVYGCNNLLNLFPSNMFRRLQILEILEVENCDSAEEIFELEALGSKKTHAIAAAQLRTLQIHDLPKLKHVWNVDSQVILSYQNLHSISVRNCDSLKSLFPASVARGLVQLEELSIRHCMMEEITAKDDGVEAEAVLRVITVGTLEGMFGVLSEFSDMILEYSRERDERKQGSKERRSSLGNTDNHFQIPTFPSRTPPSSNSARHSTISSTSILPSSNSRLDSVTATIMPSRVDSSTSSRPLDTTVHETSQAMQEEYDALLRNSTWNLVPKNSTQNIVGCKWVYKIKRNPNGTISRYKARLVAKGFHQRPGVDFTDTFSPVVKPTTVRILLCLAVTNDWPIRQLDVNNAFLQGTLTDDVFMEQPPGFIDSQQPTHVCKLKKAIYGLRQAPRAWYNELKSHLISVGFTNSHSDSSLFICRTGGRVLYVLVYVDDIIVTGSSPVHEFIQSLARRFSLKDLGPLSYFLGVEALTTSTGLFLSQRKYIRDLLHKTHMLDANVASTPLSVTDSLVLHDGSPLTDPTQYRQIVGSMQYLSLTRPDVSFAVNKLSQFMHCPTIKHWTAVKRVLRYLKGTISHGLLLHRKSPSLLHAFADADWAGNPDDRTSTTAYVVFIGANPISWSSKKQRTVARSSTEAEYRAIASTAAEVNWITNLLAELHVPLTAPPTIYCDNIGATYLSANPVFHSRMKHIAIDFHFVRDQVEKKRLRVTHVHTGDQLADSLTKSLPRKHFQTHRSKIGIVDGRSILRGHDRNNTLEVWRCNEVEILASQVLSYGESRHEIPTGQPLFLVEKDAFPSLECLSVNWNCIKREMLHGKFSEYLCKLNYLGLVGPFKETAICPSCFLHKLPNLETLSVHNGFLKKLLLCEGPGCKEKHTELPDKLSYLKLCQLSDLHMWEESSEFRKVIQNLKRLRLFLCGNLTSLMLSTMTFKNLTTLEVDKCGGLLNLMAPSVAKSLVQLTRMDITDCEMIEEIITRKEDEAVNQIIFSRLEYLGLNCLPNLTIFYSGSWTIEFPSLQKVVVNQCPNMKLFSRGVLSTPRLHTLQIAEAEDVGCWEGDLNTTIEQQYIEKSLNDRWYCMVLFAGIAAEALIYGEAEGGENDEYLFRSICLLLQPPLSIAQMSNQARWSVVQSYNLLKWHKHAHQAAIKALETGSKHVSLLFIAKDRMDQRPSDLRHNRWYNLVAMKDHGCCHDLARGGDNNGKAGHRGEENEVDMVL
ncbi:hypothetical protein EZV62_006256 [Acer yangbiense]|uniref:AAA+ ATPase domain-containing protein n=1 Tax=Acer yangbiense TaxID=1000413 RepID=A0A5C7IPV1_9ROSI|nr:hypothetical protein EZV62_006256 [Acer yangbiense]